MKKIIIFASGSGTNAENLILKLSGKNFKINWHIFTNNSNAGIISKCKNLNIKCEIFNKHEFSQTLIVQNKILEIKPDIIILAGFLLKIPPSIIDLKIRLLIFTLLYYQNMEEKECMVHESMKQSLKIMKL